MKTKIAKTLLLLSIGGSVIIGCKKETETPVPDPVIPTASMSAKINGAPVQFSPYWGNDDKTRLGGTSGSNYIFLDFEPYMLNTGTYSYKDPDTIITASCMYEGTYYVTRNLGIGYTSGKYTITITKNDNNYLSGTFSVSGKENVASTTKTIDIIEGKFENVKY